ncbi:MAG: hypothetical protein M1838_004368 [Thelocarpon superellum]|nr:MAG: hypothetical protein M1838_004368 [Thelocarpon superellum]
MVTRRDSGDTTTKGITAYLLFLVLVATTGPLQFGYHLAELNAPQAVITCKKREIVTYGLSFLPQCISMTPAEFGLVSSIYTLGGVLGALAAGPCSTRYGRLQTMRLTTVFHTLGPVFEAFAPNIPVLALGRVLSGIGSGAALVIVPVYVSEIAPPDGKGLFGALTQVMINVGILIAQLLGYFLSRGQLWRIVLAVGGFIGFAQFLGLFGASESPQWLGAHGKALAARRLLKRIRGERGNIEAEVQAWGGGIGATGDDPIEEEALLAPQPGTSRRGSENMDSASAATGHVGVLDVLRIPLYRPAIIAVVGVMLAQQLCGINSIVMYSVDLLSELLPTTSALLTVFVSAMNLVTTIICAPLADRLGRKVCLLLSIAGMGLNALLLAISIFLAIPILSAIATVLFVASFAVGLGPVPFILASELVGQEAVGATQSWALVANWSATFLVAQFFPVLNTALGRGRVYYVFAGLAAFFFAFVWWLVPETKGKRDADEVWGRERRVD